MRKDGRNELNRLRGIFEILEDRHLLTGADFNNDGLSDVQDIDALSIAVIEGGDPEIFDLNGDGIISRADVDEWLSLAAGNNQFSSPFLVGDSNLDGTVNAVDLNALKLNWKSNVIGWSKGDFNTNGVVDAKDLNMLALQWRKSIIVANDPPSVTVSLANDTAPYGEMNSDGLTFDATIAGLVNDDMTPLGALAVEAIVDGNRRHPIEVNQDGRFEFDPGFARNGSDDGPHVVIVTARDDLGSSSSASIEFTLDTVAPNSDPEIELAGETDTEPLGDGQTLLDLITLNGTTDPGVELVNLSNGSRTISDAEGDFRFYGVPLSFGLNDIHIQRQEFDEAGNAGTGTIQIEKLPNKDALVLQESNTIAAQASVNVDLDGVNGRRKIRFPIEVDFSAFEDTFVQDTLLVYVVDPITGDTLLDRGEPGTTIFAISERRTELVPGLVRFDGNTVEVNVTSLNGYGEVDFVFQLLSLDEGGGSQVSLGPFVSVIEATEVSAPRLDASGAIASVGGELALTSLRETGEVETIVENVRFDQSTGVYQFDLRIRNRGDSTLSKVGLLFGDLPAGVTLGSRSGTDGEGRPYVNFADAIPMGGLGSGHISQPVPVRIDNPAAVQFTMRPTILISTNRAPVFPQIGGISMIPGEHLAVPLQASDPDGDIVTFKLATDMRNMPTGMMEGDGTLVLRPEPGQEGKYEVEVIATDGDAETTQTVHVSVESDPRSTTRLTGVIQTTLKVPIPDVRIQVGELEVVTDDMGQFAFEVDGPLPDNTLRILAQELVSAEEYPFIAERLVLVLGHEIFVGSMNEIGRPIYLPALDTANAEPIDPNADVTVTTPTIPGATVTVAAGTLENREGQDFSGELSITEVPRDLTPAALPRGVQPDVVVTIQPGDMVFTTPAPLTLPNRANYAPGTAMDLFSINPATGEFEKVGEGRVSADRSVIETISGGIRNSSWHYFSPPPGSGGPPPGPAPPCTNSCKGTPPGPQTSEYILESGAVLETHELVTYQSLGKTRGVSLRYDSHWADPRQILRFWFNDVPAWVTRGAAVDLFASLMVSRGEFEFELPGVSGEGTNERGGNHFWRVPTGGGGVEAALQADLSAQPTGVYDFVIQAGFRGGRAGAGGSIPIVGQFVHVNRKSSVFGAGWGIDGLQEVVENPDGSALLIDHGGDAITFLPPDSGSSVYRSVPGDFSVLQRDEGGNFQRVMKDQTLYQFDTQNRLDFVRDRNGNITNYIYGEFGIAKIVDPVGLETVFSYADGLVTSIVDPASRMTQLEYDAAGNLIRITDPDDTTREFGYDSSHHMTSEIDKRGFREETFYGFHGRVERGIRKDGSQVRLSAYQTQGLYRPQETMNVDNPPMALRRDDVNAEYSDGSGNVTKYRLDRFGRIVSAVDGVGMQETLDRDDNALVIQSTDGRGNETFYIYDDKGNLVSIRDEFTPISGEVLEEPVSQAAEVADNTGDGLQRQGEGESVTPIIMAAMASNVVHWVGESDGDWNNAAGWSTGEVPGEEDFVRIDIAGSEVSISSGAVTVAGLYVGSSLSITNASLNVKEAAALIGNLEVGASAVLNVESPVTLDGGTLTGRATSSISLPMATSFQNGHIVLSGDTTTDWPELRNIDNTRITLSGGAHLSIAATSYSATGRNFNDTLFAVSGAGTVLDLSSLESINDAFDADRFNTNTHTVSVESGATIDLSNLQTIRSPARIEDRLIFDVDSVSSIDFSSLQTTLGEGQTRFDYGASNIDFVALKTAANTSFSLSPNAVLSLPQLSNWSGGSIEVPEGGTFHLPELLSASNVGMTIGTSGALNAPKLVLFTNSWLELGANQTLNAPEFENIDNSRFALNGGAQLSIAATSYSATGRNFNDTLFAVSGAGTVLDLSSLESINDAFDADRFNSNTHTVSVESGATIDLSNLQTIRSPARIEDRLIFDVDSVSSIDFSSLQTTLGEGQTRFDYGASNIDFVALKTAANTSFSLSSNAILSLPQLLSWSGGAIEVPEGGTFHLPELLSASNVGMTIGTSGALNAPKLVLFTNSRLELGANQTLNAPEFENIDNSRFVLNGGARLSIAATSYSATGRNFNDTLFAVSGAGTVLDLSSLESINDAFDADRFNTNTHTVSVESGATIDLSNLQTIRSAARSEDRLVFDVDSVSSIDFSSLQTTVGEGQIRFDYGGSNIDFVALKTAANTSFSLSSNAILSLPQLLSWSGGAIEVPKGGTFHLPELLSASNVGMTIGTSGALNAPKLVLFTNSRLELGANQTLNAPEFENIDNSRFALDGGARLSIAATSYSATGRNFNDTLFAVSGAGTVLDLSSLQRINDTFDADRFSTNTHTVSVESGATIDLSNLQTIRSPARSEDRLIFDVDGVSSIVFSSLQTTLGEGQIRFEYGGSNIDFVELTTAANTSFSLSPNAILSLPQLSSWSGGGHRCS